METSSNAKDHRVSQKMEKKSIDIVRQALISIQYLDLLFHPKTYAPIQVANNASLVRYAQRSYLSITGITSTDIKIYLLPWAAGVSTERTRGYTELHTSMDTRRIPYSRTPAGSTNKMLSLGGRATRSPPRPIRIFFFIDILFLLNIQDRN